MKKGRGFSIRVENTVGERRNCSSRPISPFFHNVFKRILRRTRKNKGLFGKGFHHGDALSPLCESTMHIFYIIIIVISIIIIYRITTTYIQRSDTCSLEETKIPVILLISHGCFPSHICAADIFTRFNEGGIIFRPGDLHCSYNNGNRTFSWWDRPWFASQFLWIRLIYHVFLHPVSRCSNSRPIFHC